MATVGAYEAWAATGRVVGRVVCATLLSVGEQSSRNVNEKHSRQCQARSDSIAPDDNCQYNISIVDHLSARWRAGTGYIVVLLLNSPGVASTPEEGVAMLRKWGRWISRARGMGASLPDASLLMAGLDQLSSQVLGSYPSIAFHLNLIRTEYRLDHVPEHDTVALFARSIQSELEQAVISPSQGTSPKRPRVAKFDTEMPKGAPPPPKGDSTGESKGKGPKGDGHNTGAFGRWANHPGANPFKWRWRAGRQQSCRGERVQRLDWTVPHREAHLRELVIVNLHVHSSCLTMAAATDVTASVGMMHRRQAQRSLNVGRVDQCIIGNRIARHREGPRVQNQMVQ